MAPNVRGAGDRIMLDLAQRTIREIEHRAVRDIVRFLVSLGPKGITYGKFRRTYFYVGFLERLQGIETKGGIAVGFNTAATTWGIGASAWHASV